MGQDLGIEEELAEELQEVLGGRVPTPEDLPRLRYTEMVLKETMRLYPAVWGIGRRALRDCEFGGYRVPAGSKIFVLEGGAHSESPFVSLPGRLRLRKP